MNLSLAPSICDLDSGGAILVADDDPLVRKSIAISLKEFKILEARDGAEALDIINRENLDLILLDEQMPGHSGVAVCRELRKHEDTAYTPVLVFTGHGGDEKKIEALEAGANDFMSKPLSPIELKVRVNNLMTSSFYQKSLHQKNSELEITLEKLEKSSTQLIRSQRLLAMSRFSSGMLHHLNNPLNHAKTALALARQLVPAPREEGKACRETLDDAVKELERVVAVIQHLRGFSQNENASLRIFDLSQVIRTSIAGSKHTGQTVEIIEKIPDSIEFNGDLMLISQIVDAIVENAFYAFSQQEVQDKPQRFEVTLENHETFVEMTYTDNAGGIDSGILTKVTDPFFTTKLSGSGAGLGLAFVEAVATFYNGSLEISSSPGSTTVKVRLAQG